MADKTITRNRYGKHMRALLLILMQRPGQWYTIGRDNITVQAAKALHKKRAIEMSEDGKRARVLVGTNAPVPRVNEAPDGWIVYAKVREDESVDVVTDKAVVDGLLRLGYITNARPFKFLD